MKPDEEGVVKAAVPIVTVNLVRFTRALSGQSMIVSAKVDNENVQVNWLLDSSTILEQNFAVQVVDSLFQPNSNDDTQLRLTNNSQFTHKLEARVRLGIAQPVTVMKPVKQEDDDDSPRRTLQSPIG